MKSYVLAALLVVGLLGLSTAASAQTTLGGGIKGGVNFATVTGDFDDDVTKSRLTGAIFGGFITAQFNSMWAFQPEVLYSQGGVKAKFVDGTTSIEVKNKVDFVDIPLLLRAGKKSMGGAAGYFLAGPSIGFITKAKASAMGVEEDFKDDLKSTTWAFVLGGGVTVKHILFEARYSIGLTDVNKEGSEEGSNKSQIFSVLAGVEW